MSGEGIISSLFSTAFLSENFKKSFGRAFHLRVGEGSERSAERRELRSSKSTRGSTKTTARRTKMTTTATPRASATLRSTRATSTTTMTWTCPRHHHDLPVPMYALPGEGQACLITAVWMPPTLSPVKMFNNNSILLQYIIL